MTDPVEALAAALRAYYVVDCVGKSSSDTGGRG